jgi:hypothetical protein
VASASNDRILSLDKQGLATFLVSPGEVSLCFFLPGPGVYVGDAGNGGRATRSFNSTNLEEISVTLDVPPIEGRLVTLHGDVVGPDGRPVADAVIQPAAGQFVTANVYSAIYAAPSNDDGTFELREVPAGRKLFLYVIAQRLASQQSTCPPSLTNRSACQWRRRTRPVWQTEIGHH